ncbi:MAG: DUF1318 domain-containing protein [Sphingomicrobium sp.]
MIRAMLAAVLLALAPAVAAQTPAVDAARAEAALGERYDGYIGIAAPLSTAARSQVARINIQRRALYSRLAASRGASPQEVGVTAGCELLARVGVGEAYMLSDGAWRRRAAGQGAPTPDYCR